MGSTKDQDEKTQNPKHHKTEQKVKKTGEELLQLVSFNLGDEEFGVEILRVQ